MSLLEELYGAEEAEEAEELERIIEGDSDDDGRRGGDDEAEEAEEEKRKVDPAQPKSVRVVKHPRVVLNPARLTGPRGLQALPGHFKDFKFKGRGHEAEDLDVVLKRLEHWAHRLYPKFQFEDCLKKIESLKKKRPVMVQLRKIRSDQIISDEFVIQKDSSDDEAAPGPPEPAPDDEEFDKLLAQQIELARATPGPDSARKAFPHTPMRSAALAPKATSSPSISDDQKQRMLRNRQMAEERRLARMRKNVISTPNGNNSDVNVNGTIAEASNNNSNDSDQVVHLTGIDQTASLQLSVTSNQKENINIEEVIDMTGDADSKVSNVRELKSFSGFVNLDDNDEEMRDFNDGNGSLQVGNNRKYMDVDSNNSDSVKLTMDSREKSVEISDDEIDLGRSKKKVPLNYSDSSDEDCEVTTYNVSVTADIHKASGSRSQELDQLDEKEKNSNKSMDEQNAIGSERDTTNKDLEGDHVLVTAEDGEDMVRTENISKEHNPAGKDKDISGGVVCHDKLNVNHEKGTDSIEINDLDLATGFDMNDDWGQ